tara:strand:+ start:722 stop:1315 length:594 start_codon:yes stop_codon:yes gene_type:complete
MDLFYTYIDFIVSSNNSYIFILFFLFIFFYSFFSIPGLLIIVSFTGYIFGTLNAYFISIFAITLGSLNFFLFSKTILKKYFFNFYDKYSNKFGNYISKSSFEYLILFRLIFGLPLIVQNFCLSLLNISILKFFLSTLIGLTPYIVAASIVGNKFKNLQSLRKINISDILTYDLILLIVIIISMLIFRIFYKKIKKPS